VKGESLVYQARYYDFLVHNEEKRAEKLRSMHRNPGVEGRVEVESEWTATRRGNQLPKHLRQAAKPG